MKGYADELSTNCTSVRSEENMTESQPETLGEEIRRVRVSQEIGLRQLAGLLGIAPSYLSDIEHDRRVPSEAVLQTLCDQLSIDLEHALSLSGRFGEAAERNLKKNPALGSLLRRVSNANLDRNQIAQLHDVVSKLENSSKEPKRNL